MLRTIFLLCFILCCTACVKTAHVSGHLFEEKEINALKQSKSKQDIENLLGSPTTISNFGDETWYYITTKKQRVAFWPDKVLEQNIIAIDFKANGTIQNIIRYSEKDAKNHKLVTDITFVKGNDTTKAQQFFGNIGRFSKNKKEAPPLPRTGF